MSTKVAKDWLLWATLAKWLEATSVQHKRCFDAWNEPANGTNHSFHASVFEAIFLMEAMAQSINPARRLCPDRLQTYLNDDVCKLLIDLRNMNIHQLDYREGKGRQQEKFHADTPFGHTADGFMRVEGRLVAGGRLSLLETSESIIAFGRVLVAEGTFGAFPPDLC